MKKARSGALLIAVLTVVLALSALMSVYADITFTFEAPPYTEALLAGQDGWTTNDVGATHWYVTTPGLQGQFSAWTESYSYAFHSIAGQTINDNVMIIDLMQLWADERGTHGMFLLLNTDGNPYAGLWFMSDGVVAALNVGSTAWEGTSYTWIDHHTYKMSYVFDFTGQQYKFSAKDLTNDATSFTLDWHQFSFPTTSETAAGQIQIGGQFALHDNVSVETIKGKLQGTVAVADFSGTPDQLAAIVELSQGGVIARTEHIALPADGSFTVSEILPGTYDIGIKERASLRKQISGVTILPNETYVIPDIVVLTNGDLDGDNEITSTDLSILGLGLGLAGD